MVNHTTQRFLDEGRTRRGDARPIVPVEGGAALPAEMQAPRDVTAGARGRARRLKGRTSWR